MVCDVARNRSRDETSAVGNRLEALRASEAFRGPIDPSDGHDGSNHLALVYETQAEQFSAAIPFVSQGLDRGDRCVYIVDENTRADVLNAMRSADIDVDAALESGALVVPTAQDIYIRDGTFDPGRMLPYIEDAIDEARREHEGFRATSEMTWVLDNEVDVEDVFEYEARVNDRFSDEDCIMLCQYNRDRFSPDVIRHAIRTHPHIVSDTTVSQNIYYTPPEEFVDSEQTAAGIDQKIGSLQRRTEAQIALEEQRWFLRNLYDVGSGRNRPFEEKIEAMLELGCEYFGLDIGAVTHRPTHDDEYEIAVIVGPGTSEFEDTPPVQPEPGCFCRHTMEQDVPIGTTDVRDVGWDHDLLHDKYGLTAYFGVKLVVGTTPYGTLWFGDTEPRDEPFTDVEYTILELIGQWVNYELERHERERYLRTQHEITASPTRSFEDKLQALFDLGCERFDLELGAIARIDPDADRFQIEYVSDEHDHFQPGIELPLSETFCAAATDSEGTESVSAPLGDGAEDITVYRKFGLKAYLGTYVPVDGGVDRTFFFVSSELRDEPFPEQQRTFLRLMGQWVKYELERKQREQRLRDRQVTLEAQNDALNRMNRMNTLVQELVQVLVEEPTRAEVEQTVCDRLAASDRYHVAWIEECPLSTSGKMPRAWAGIEESSLRAITNAISESDHSPALGQLAVETRQVQVVQHVADESSFDGYRQQLREHDVESALAVPIRYRDTCYGALVVYAAHAEAFEERQQAVFEQFGETLGFAIAAADRKQALAADEAVELELRVSDSDRFFFHATTETDAELTLEGQVARDGGSSLVYITATGAPAETLLEIGEQDAAVENCRLVDGQGEKAYLEFVFTTRAILSTFAEYGATVTDASASDGTGTFTVELPQTADAQSLITAARETFSSVEVVAKRTVDRPVQTDRLSRTTFTERLTDKQREVLRAAYLAGYFDRPRTSTGEELATTLGISSSTFHQHCQVGLRKLLATVVEETPTDRPV